MDFRYSLPPESKAKLFFNADDDLIFTCDKLTKAFHKWKKFYIGDIVPLLGYRTMSFNFDSENGDFDVKNIRVSPMFRQTLIGLTWISRHFLDLYNANQTWEVQEIRKIVAETNNCDDLAMNFIVNHFYREIHSVQIDYDDVTIDIYAKNRQAMTKNFVLNRNGCNKKFVEIFGYNPLPTVAKFPKENY